MANGLQIVRQALTEETLRAYAEVPTSFRVERIFRVDLAGGGLEGVRLVEEAVAEPYEKDYDADPGEAPLDLPKRFDVTNWSLLAAFEEGTRVGGAILAVDTPSFDFLEGRPELAAVMGIRVIPSRRRQGVGSTLFDAAITVAKEHGCRQLKVETQNVNLPACRFYAHQGCELGAINRFAYLGQHGAAHPDEVQLVWYLRLA